MAATIKDFYLRARDAGCGRFVSVAYALANKATTIVEKVAK